jgi:alpha-L-rhamnosidase
MTTHLAIAIPVLALGVWLLAAPASAAADAGGLTAAYLRCEYRVDPLGIDEPRPRLSWRVESRQRGQKQTAYRVLVASREATLKADRGDLWDSGKVAGGETVAVVYAGKPLASHRRCFWKVRVWDRDGKPSAWSKPALWSMGLLKQAEWKAQWIGYDRLRKVELPEAPLAGAKWIGFAGDRPLKAPKGQRLYVGQLRVPPKAKVKKAELLALADDKLWLVLNGQTVVTGKGLSKKLAGLDVTAHVRPGVNELRARVENKAEGPTGLLVKLVVTTAEGKTITAVSDGRWRGTDKPGTGWEKRKLNSGAWPACRVLGGYGCAPWGKVRLAGLLLPPPSYLRHAFRTGNPVRRALVYATALGLYDLYLNGRRVSDDYFNPGWTDYAKRVYYRAYDVTPLVRRGDNVLGAVLADGWYSGYVGYGGARNHYGSKPRFRAQLHLEHDDGSTTLVATGPDWKASAGALREADFLMGETYDARRAPDGWDRPGFDDSKWERVVTGAEVRPGVRAHPGPPVRAIAEFKPVKVTEPRRGVYVLDLGQNFAGVARLKVTGKRGQKITLRFAERLEPGGMIYTANLRSARATDTYICRGGGKPETWQPRLTYHGFQYVEVRGLGGRPAADTVVGVALGSATPVVGEFACSDPMLNRLHRNVYWTQRMNFIDVPTDCPQRDERLGWTGDAQVYIRTATLNCDVQAFFTKWLVDLADAQRADGQFPAVAPLKVAGGDGGPAWSDAGVICPWTIYEVYGDRRVLERHYPAMTRFIEFCRKRCTSELLPPKKFHCYGDWLSVKAATPADVIFTAYFAHSTQLTVQAAEVLGKKQDAARYRALLKRIKAAFNKAYVGADGRIKGNTEACYVLALAFDLLGPGKQKPAVKYLVEDIEQRGGHLSTGFIGTKDLMLVLAKVGRDDVAYRLLGNDTFPSWGFSIKHGATSIWERWDGWTPEKGFQTPAMNSFAHYSFGAVYQWMVENIGGIRSDGPAYRKIVIAPQPGGKLTRAAVAYDSIHGRIESRWQRQGKRFELAVTVPANTTALVLLPAGPGATLTEGGQALAKAAGVRLVRREGGRAVLAVASGSYRFAAVSR